VPVRIPLQKYAGIPLQKKVNSTSPLTQKSAGIHSFKTGAAENSPCVHTKSKNRRFVDTVVSYFGSWKKQQINYFFFQVLNVIIFI
jgi:hypothetical protein